MPEWAREKGRPEQQWRLEERVDSFLLTLPAGREVFAGEDLARLSVKRGWFRAALLVD
ncbi:MAG: hypothetical protein QOG60_2594, partial [Frankiaceae bacterium]|nr:hypothetical protein [Frankiaceae bacterium]